MPFGVARTRWFPYISNSNENLPNRPVDAIMRQSPTTNRFGCYPAPRPLIAGLLVSIATGWLIPAADAASPQVAEHRSRLELSAVPRDPVQVLDVLTQLKKRPQQAKSAPVAEVTVAGQIGGMPNPWRDSHPDFPWFAGQASFFMLDSKVAVQFANHAKHHGGDHNCAFCQRLAEKSAHAVAVVNLVNEAGQIVPIDSRELFPLKEGQSVVVRGRAELLGGTMLVIHADGLHVRR
jgi:hypothetical protein